MTAEFLARAKINLALHVTGRRADGFHTIDTLVVFTEFGDLITLREQENPPEVRLSIKGPFADSLASDHNNMVIQAMTMLEKQTGETLPPVAITLEKNLPVASGIGGGSADAATTLMALKDFWQLGLETDIETIASNLGADVPMCLHSTPLRAQGIGEEITLLDASEPLHLLLVNPGVEISTPEIFRNLGNKINPPVSEQPLSHFPDTGNLATLRNDLEKPALEIAPVIGEVLSALRNQEGCQFARMSGSGATCFGIFDSPELAEDAKNRMLELHPDWWCVATRSNLA